MIQPVPVADHLSGAGAATWGLGLEFRPMDSVLLRGNYNTSFRAPDMHYLFADESGFFNSTRDIYQCRVEAADNGVPYNELQCDPNSQLAGVRQGELGLREEDGKSFNFGIVVSPNNDLKFSVDYFDIELENVVTDMDIQQLARDEADCQLGVTTTGQPVDINSAECMDVLSRVTRLPTIDPTEIPDYDTFFIGPINNSLRHQTGFDAAVSYDIETQATGTFGMAMSYTHVLKDEQRVYEFDPIEEDFRDNLQNFNARSVVNASLNWDISDFNTTLYAFRLGSMPNWQETGRLPTWTIYNATATMMFMDDKLAVTGIVNNVLDTRPPYDDGFNTWPFFFRGQYNARGREAFLQLRYTFE
jgi:outer membrane receptor protein involved in Fe transport